MGMRDEDNTKFIARLPTPMHLDLKAQAKAAGRSLNAEIVHRLAQTLGEDFAAEQPEAQPVLAEMAGYLRELRDMARAQAEQSRLSAAAAAD
ncbi:Arc family DNA-binding protein [Delftia tsuruhatensis]|nr:Arc family DNA-binding protein [Delftia tsuruhatensis]SFB22695.1 Arc-like DNA binding domain-containing protein [Delftia tsuruhatensis]